MTTIVKSSNTNNSSLRAPRRTMPESVIDAIVEAYTGGESENSLAKRYGVSRQVIRHRLLSRGVTRRTQSEAETLKWKKIKATPGGVERQCAAAWKAAEDKAKERTEEIIRLYQDPTNGGAKFVAEEVGCSKSNVKRVAKKFQLAKARGIRHAAGVEKSSFLSPVASIYEFELIGALTNHGLDPIHQMRVGTRNVDLAFPDVRVAVELERRYIRDSHSITTERLKSIFDAGWRILVIEDARRQGLILRDVCQQIVAFLDFIRSNPTTPGQYGVIGCDGETITRESSYLDGFTRVEGF